MTCYFCRTIHIGTCVVNPVTILLNRLTAVATAKSIFYVIRAPDDDISSWYRRRVTTAIHSRYAAFLTTIDDDLCFFVFGRQIVSLVATAIDGLNLVVLMSRNAVSVGIYLPSGIYLNEHVTQRTTIQVVTAKHTTSDRYSRVRRVACCHHVFCPVCECHAQSAVLADVAGLVDKDLHVAIHVGCNRCYLGDSWDISLRALFAYGCNTLFSQTSETTAIDVTNDATRQCDGCLISGASRRVVHTSSPVAWQASQFIILSCSAICIVGCYFCIGVVPLCA